MIVALYMGAWIEIFLSRIAFFVVFVALYMGAWIEIVNNVEFVDTRNGRTLYGCVD